MAYGRPKHGTRWKGKRDQSAAERSRASSQLLTGEKKVQRDWETEHDNTYGYEILDDGPPRVGYLTNMLPTSIANEDRIEKSAIDLYFLQQDGKTFKAQLQYEPYFYVVCPAKWNKEVSALLERKYEALISGLSSAEMEDLDMPNHLSGIRRSLLKLRFRSVQELMEVRSELMPKVQANKARAKQASRDATAEVGRGA